MSALYPDNNPYEGSPFKRFQRQTEPRFNPSNPFPNNSKLNLSPTKSSASFSHFKPSGQRSPFSKRTAGISSSGSSSSSNASSASSGPSYGLAATKEPKFHSSESLSSNLSNLSTNTDSTTIRRSENPRRFHVPSQNPSNRHQNHNNYHNEPIRSPVKLRATTNRLARQANDIISSLDSQHYHQNSDPIPARVSRSERETASTRSTSEREDYTALKRSVPPRSPRAPGSPTKLEPAFDPLMKRRKIVSFENDSNLMTQEDSDQDLREVVLALQEQMVRMQEDHNKAIVELRKMVLEQSRMVSELLKKK